MERPSDVPQWSADAGYACVPGTRLWSSGEVWRATAVGEVVNLPKFWQGPGIHSGDSHGSCDMGFWNPDANPACSSPRGLSKAKFLERCASYRITAVWIPEKYYVKLPPELGEECL